MAISTEHKQRKNRYTSGLAQLRFEVPNAWTKEESLYLYQTKNHKVPIDQIVYEDCITGMENIPPASVDLVIADPPFGIEFSGKTGQYNRKAELVTDGYKEITENYAEFTEKWVSMLPKIMKPTASAYIVSGWTNLGDVINSVKKAGLTVVNHLIWKYQFGVFTKKKFVTSHYHILFLVKDEKKYFFNKYEFYPEDVWMIPREYKSGQEKNGTKLPEKLIERFINFSTRPGEMVFDPFMGNGTTATCAKGMFRRYYGFEINQNMKSVHESLIVSVKPGCYYRDLREMKPTVEDLVRKYPHLRKYLDLSTVENENFYRFDDVDRKNLSEECSK